jgi:hypothetical protein
MARPKKNPDAPKAPAVPKVFAVVVGSQSAQFIRAATKAAAIRHATQGTVSVSVVPDALIEALSLADKVQDITQSENPSN